MFSILSTKLCGLGFRSTENYSFAASLVSRSMGHSLCTVFDPNRVWEISERDSAAAHRPRFTFLILSPVLLKGAICLGGAQGSSD